MRILPIITVAAVAAAPVVDFVKFEKEPQALHGGKSAKSPKLISRRAQGLLTVYTVPGQRGADLYYSSSNDVGESWSEAQRVNHVPGEVTDHGENSPQLFLSPDEMTLYAFWNSRDAKGSHIRFASGGAMMTTWSPAVTLEDDASGASHGFQGAAVGPDGTLYAAWLDGRDKEAAKTANYTAGAASIYLTRSTDGGKTWSKNVRLATDVCPCCRVSFAFAGGRTVLAWRGIAGGDMRDVYSAMSADKGATWSKPVAISKDNWQIKGCPHVGPSLTAVGDKIHAIWFSEAGGKPAIYQSSTTNGQTFTPRRLISEGTADPTHPYVAGAADRVGIAFQARDAKATDSWGKMNIYYRELLPNGTLSPLVVAGAPKEGSVTYPSIALGMSGRTFVAWTESRGEQGTRAMLVRGRR